MKELDITTPNSYARGFSCAPTHAELLDYLENNQHYNKEATLEILNKIKSYSKVCLLQDLWVSEDMQGQGLGQKIMEGYITLAKESGAAAVVLLLDTVQPQRINFSLREFYKTLGFNSLDYPDWMIKIL